jgi:predicted O-linked N-acetylglucosamine transferase (SPINDLY family)
MATLSEALAIGLAHHRAGRLDWAEEVYRSILRQEPEHAETLHLAGALAYEARRYAEAVERIRRAIRVEPRVAQYHNSLGLALMATGEFDAAAAACRRAIELRPDYALAHNNLGLIRKRQGRLAEASACYRQALQLQPDYAEAHVNLAVALEDEGQPLAAIACYRQALQIKPDWSQVHSHLLHVMHFCEEFDSRQIFAEHRLWNRLHAAPLAGAIEPHENDRSPERRLRVGYVSPNFRLHPVGRFFLPLVESHDHENHEIFCYASARAADAITAQCRARADVWRDVQGLSDAQLAERVRADRIDILVDLTMHMEDSRLRLFARKPAPVQVTYLAYCSTTGLDAIDYRLSDPYLDADDASQQFYSEETIRLPETYWCYRPVPGCPDVNRLPALASGDVTFGCLNSFCKVTAPTLAAWCRLLASVPQSRIVLHAAGGVGRDRVRRFAAEQGVSPERWTFVDALPLEKYLEVYQQIDVALDPFPYGGGTTTCDALWMGVPVVSLAGQTAVGRGGLSILSNLGLPDLVAHDPQQYVQIAADLAGDLPRLAGLRAALRSRMERSPLMDAPRFARNVEAAYRSMWRRWCGDQRPTRE